MEEPPGSPSRADIAATYDRIATHFAETRTHPWPAVAAFVADHGPVARALDLGCGNGRHFEMLTDAAEETVGLDLSRALLEVAATRPQPVALVRGDAVQLPIRTDTVDLCLFVATLHHLPTKHERARSLAEVARVLRPDGRALVSAWSVTHDKFDADEGHDRWVDWTLPSGEVVPRFYHVFDHDEFVTEVTDSGVRTERSFERAGNCYAIVRGS